MPGSGCSPKEGGLSSKDREKKMDEPADLGHHSPKP